MNRIIITGGAGFVGSHLVQRIQTENPNAHIVVIDDFRTGTFANLAHDRDGDFRFGGELIARSLNDLALDELIEHYEPDVVFHEASITDTTVTDQAKMMIDNVEPFEALLEAVVQSDTKLVWASSAATYGIHANGATAARRPFVLGDAGCPANVYGFSKWVMENAHRRMLAKHPDAHIVGLRYFNVFGPGEQNKDHMASMVFRLAQQMLNGQRPRVFVDGEQARDQVYVLDVVDATLAAASNDAKSGIYNVGSGSATTFNQIIGALNEALGTDHKPDYFENPYKFYQDYTCADLTQTRIGLRWQPSFDVQQAIIQYARWLQNNWT